MGAYEHQGTPILPTTGSLTITSTPPGSSIFLDGTSTGTITPATLTNIIPGTYTVTLTKAGYYDWSGSVTVLSDQTAYIYATLTTLPIRAALPDIGSSSSYLVYYGQWDQDKVDEAETFNIVILHPDSNITPLKITDIKNGVDDISGNEDDVIVIGYLSIGEHGSETPAIGDGTGPDGYASWYMDADSNNCPDKNGQWGSFYVNAVDLNWQTFIKIATLQKDGISGTDYIINTLGCDGLFLDTIDTASPWGSYSSTAKGMASLVQTIGSWYSDKFIIANRGLFYFDHNQPAYQWNIRPYINGVMFESYLTEWDWNNNKGTLSPYFNDNKTNWAKKINIEATKSDGFTVFCLDYLNPGQEDYNTLFNTQINEVIHQQGWVDYISSINLDTIRYDVYHYLHRKIGSLTIDSGNNQQSTISTTIVPFVVKVTDTYGNPVGSYSVIWQIIEPGYGANLSATLTTTNGNGTTSTIFTLGTKTMDYTVLAKVNELSATFTATAILQYGTLSVTSTPAGANIFLDGTDMGTVTPAILTSIIPGTHTIKLTKPGYYDWSATVTVTAGTTTPITATLTMITGTLSVTSTPSGAIIFLDGTSTGTITPAILTNIIPGTHTIKLTKPGYYDWSSTVTVIAGTTTPIAATLTMITGSISVTSTPPGAIIFLDGTSTGTITPAILTNIIPGTHTIKLTKAGYYDWSASVTVTAGTATPVIATMTLTVSISSPINGAILVGATQTLLSGTVIGTDSITGTLTYNGIASTLNIAGGSFTTTITLHKGKNIIIVSVRKQAGNTGFATVIIEVADKKEIIPPGQKPTIALDDSTKIEILDNPFTNATATITINDNPDEANFALADQNLPKGVDISGLAEAVREFKLFERENANAGTTTGRFKITIPYPATIPDDKARDLKIYWLNTDANRWELAGGKSDMANHTVTVEVTHLSIFRAAFLSSPLPPKVIVYPNPYNARRDDRIYFKGTIELSLIRIFTLSGELVKEIKASNNTQDWDVKNAAGCTLASGMYFYLITDTQGNKATGKIAVIR